MDFELPSELSAYLEELDDFIEREIRPLEEQDDNIRFFDHRREHSRTDWDRGGLPRPDWRPSSPRPVGELTRPGTTATRSRRPTEAGTGRTSTSR
jgi:hypothetical protein